MITYETVGNEILKVETFDSGVIIKTHYEWVVEPEKLLPLDEYKKLKIAELDNQCNKFTKEYFISDTLGEPHQYSYSDDAQKTLHTVKLAMNDFPDEMTYGWRIIDTDEVVQHNKTQFNRLFLDSVLHLQIMTEKFRYYEGLIKLAESIEEVDEIMNSVVWRDEIVEEILV